MRQQLSRASKAAVQMNPGATPPEPATSGMHVAGKRTRAGYESVLAKGRRKREQAAGQSVCDDRLEADDAADETEIDIDSLSLPMPSDVASSVRRNIEQYWEQKALHDALKDTFEEI